LGAKLGNSISNVRFALPIFALLSVSIKNIISGDANIESSLFSTVSAEQFGCIILGFLTYRVPLFLRRIQEGFSDVGATNLPGSAGVAASLLSGADADLSASNILIDEVLKPVLLVSGPPGTDKTALINKLIEDSDGKFVRPILNDRLLEGAKFEFMEGRGEFFEVTKLGRFGLSKDNILNSADPEKGEVVVIDADTKLAKKISSNLSGARIIGVWFSLDSVDKFKEKLQDQIDSGKLKVPMDEDADQFLRAKRREVVADIEYGVVSDLFDFMIVSDDFDSCYKQLENAAGFCFR